MLKKVLTMAAVIPLALAGSAKAQEVVRLGNLKFAHYGAVSYIKEIAPRPILLIHGANAHSRYFSETAYAAAAEPKELMIIPDANHIDLYDRMDIIPFERLDTFFRQHFL